MMMSNEPKATASHPDGDRIPVVLIASSQIICMGLMALFSETKYSVVDCGSCFQNLDRDKIVEFHERNIMFLIEASRTGIELKNEILEIKKSFSLSKFIILATNPDKRELKTCLEVGANAYLLPDATTELLSETMGLVMRDQSIFPSEFTLWNSRKSNTHWVENNAAPDLDLEDLSDRERMILQCLVGGMSNKEISREVNMPDSTVKLYLQKIQNKIKANNRVQAAVWAINNGLQPARDFVK